MKPKPPEPRFWQRGPLKPKQRPAKEPDAVRAARLSRHGAFAAATVGVVATLATGFFTYHIGSQQITTANERSQAEFLRTQRQTEYVSFTQQESNVYEALVDFTNLFTPGTPRAPVEVYTDAYKKYKDEWKKLINLHIELTLVASVPVRYASNQLTSILFSHNQRVETGMSYIVDSHPDDDISRQVPLTVHEVEIIDDALSAFEYSARTDLGVPNSPLFDKISGPIGRIGK